MSLPIRAMQSVDDYLETERKNARRREPFFSVQMYARESIAFYLQ